MDWLGKFLNLPKEYLNCSEGPGGGVIQGNLPKYYYFFFFEDHFYLECTCLLSGSASEAILVAMLTAREQSVKRLQKKYPDMSESDIRGKLVMYSSDQSNSAVEKSAHLTAVPIRLLSVDENQSLRGETLKAAIEEDLKNGKFPIACITTLGTTGTCAFDNLNEIGPICQEHDVWLHIDAAYAGSALCCPEFRSLMQGIEYCDSFNFNLHKWMMVNNYTYFCK